MPHNDLFVPPLSNNIQNVSWETKNAPVALSKFYYNLINKEQISIRFNVCLEVIVGHSIIETWMHYFDVRFDLNCKDEFLWLADENGHNGC